MNVAHLNALDNSQFRYEKTSSNFDIGKNPWIDAKSPNIVSRNNKTISKIIKQMIC